MGLVRKLLSETGSEAPRARAPPVAQKRAGAGGGGTPVALPPAKRPRLVGGGCKVGLVAQLLSESVADATGARRPRPPEKRPRAGGTAATRQVAKRRRLASSVACARPVLARPRPTTNATTVGFAAVGSRRGDAAGRALATPRPTEDLVEDVGAAEETQEAHLARHDGGNLACPRCRFYAFGVAWRKAYGGHRTGTVGGLRRREPGGAGLEVFWLQERPPRWGGQWALGCAFCRLLLDKMANKRFPAPGASECSAGIAPDERWQGRGGEEASGRCRTGTRWARYEVRPRTLQAANIAQHVQSREHLAAERAFFLPDSPEVQLLGHPTPEEEDAELLRGAVPQLPDWLRAFRMVNSPASFRSAALASKTEHYIRSIRKGPVQRRAMAQMVRVMAEALRARKRAWVRGAFSLTLSIDDKGPYRLIRFKADAAAPWLVGPVGRQARRAGVGEAAGAGVGEAAGVPDAGRVPDIAGTCGGDGAGQAARVGSGAEDAALGRSTSPGARAGVLAVLHTGHNLEPEDFDEDYSERMCATVLQAIRRFCTPHPPGRPGDGECDEALLHHFLCSVRVYMADGGPSVQKCGAFLQRSCPNLIIVARDPTHYIRIACRDPLHREERFAAQWTRLFDSRHALIADIKNSDQWKARLEACQRRVLAVDGSQGGGLTSILKHLSFAKQRFDSFVGPRRKYICLLQAIVMLLCGIAGDPRQKKAIRDRAEAALDAITPADTLACGMAADFAEECLAFIRCFDVGEHDCAQSPSQKRKFQRALKILFLDGYIYADPAKGTRGGLAPRSSGPGGGHAPRSSGSRGGQAPQSSQPEAAAAGHARRVEPPPSQRQPADAGHTRGGQALARARPAAAGPAQGSGEAPQASRRRADGGRGAGPPGREAPLGSPPAGTPKTLTAVALEQMAEMRVFYYGTKRKILWSQGAALEGADILRSMQAVCKATLARLDADMAPHDLLMQFEAFNLSHWQEIKDAHRSAGRPARGPQERTVARQRRAQEERLRRLGSALNLNEAALVQQFDRALVAALRLWRRLRDAHRAENLAPPDNRACWASVLCPPGVAPQQQADLTLGGSAPELEAVIRLYLSVADTTGNVERNLGDVALLCGRHLGPLDPAGRTVSDLLEVYLDGPQREEDVAAKAATVQHGRIII